MGEKPDPQGPETPRQSRNVARQISTFKYETRPAILELLKSEDPVVWKLGKILMEAFDYFAVRYVNIRQYEEYLRQGYSTGPELMLAGVGEANGFQGQSFQEFFRQHSAHWQKSVAEQTDWPISIEGMKENDAFPAMLRACKKEARANEKTEGSLREKTMILLQQKMLADIEKGIEGSRQVFYEDELMKKYRPFAMILKSSRTPSLAKIRETFGEKGWSDRRLTEAQMEAMERFFNNPASMTAEDVRALRDIITDTSRNDLGMRGEQYQVAIIFDPKVLKTGKDDLNYGPPPPGKGWWSDMKGKPEQEILAVIPLMKDRTLTQKIIELSQASGKLAHPVIDSEGFVRYPQKKMNILDV